MAKPDYYHKKIGKRGSIELWQVDGAKIRATLEKEFTNFGQHFRFACIPENEFWIDKEASGDELRFFIDHLLAEWLLMKNGYSFSDATQMASVKEQSERQKTKDIQKVADHNGQPVPQNVHLKLLKSLPDNLVVWQVDGRLVRSNFYIDFTQGGHDLVYNFVPKNEVWIDNDLSESETPYIILHELYERSLMSKGLTYNQAHRHASRLEWHSRQNPDHLKKHLLQLGWQD